MPISLPKFIKKNLPFGGDATPNTGNVVQNPPPSIPGTDPVDANKFYAGPVSGGDAVASFRKIVAADLGTGTANTTKYLRGDLTWQTFPTAVTPSTPGLTAVLGVSNTTIASITTSNFIKASTLVLPWNSFNGTLEAGAITANRTYTFPDVTGTVAMKNYKEYAIRLYQTGTNNPQAGSTFINEVEAGVDSSDPLYWNVILQRSGVGTYTVAIYKAGVQYPLGSNKIQIAFGDGSLRLGSSFTGSGGGLYNETHTFYNYDTTGNLVDGISNVSMSIKVWN
jgi:hypothetical protein